MEGMAMDERAMPEPKLPDQDEIRAEANRIDGLMNPLTAVVSNLEERLAPVLVQAEDPKSVPPSDVRPSRESPLGEQLAQHADALANLIGRVDSITSKVRV